MCGIIMQLCLELCANSVLPWATLLWGMHEKVAAKTRHDLLSEVIVSAQAGFALLLLALSVAVHPLQL